MKTQHTVLLAMLVGFGLGGLAVKVLHAQARAPGYMIAEIDVIDEAGYKKFVEGTSATVPASGGRYIVRGGRTSVVNGASPKRVAVIQWESYEKAQSYFNSEAYKQLIPLRDKSSNARIFVIEGVAN
jgi:uncharacterized protein (DUF1330 family)